MLGLLGALKKTKPEDETVTIPYDSTRIFTQGHTDDKNGLICFGSNVYGRLGILDELLDLCDCELVRVPRLIGTILSVDQIACGAAHTICCVEGQCYSWGKCHFSQLGQGHEWMNCFSPTLIPKENFKFNSSLGVDKSEPCLKKSDVIAVSVGCGESHSMIISADGDLFTFGCGYSGALGHGSENHELYPRQVLFVTNDTSAVVDEIDRFNSVHVVQATGGKCHTIVSTKEGNIWTFGKNNKGQLGLGPDLIGYSQLRPKKMSNFAIPNPLSNKHRKCPRVYAGRGGDISGCIINEDLYLWGDNEHGALGVEINCENESVQFKSVVSYPIAIDLNKHKCDVNNDDDNTIGVLQVAIGSNHVVALSTQHQLYSWGMKGPWLGKAVSPSSTETITPCQIFLHISGKNEVISPEVEKPVHISCGEKHSIVVTDKGGVYTCGSSYMNKLGVRKSSLDAAASLSTEPDISLLCKVQGLDPDKGKAMWALAGSNHTSVIVSSPSSPPSLSPPPSSSSLPFGTITAKRFNQEAKLLEEITHLQDTSAQKWKLIEPCTNDGNSIARIVHKAAYLSLVSPLIRASSLNLAPSPCIIQNPSDGQLDEIELEEVGLENDETTLPLEQTFRINMDNKNEGLSSSAKHYSWKCSIVYNDTWSVPVFYFNVYMVKSNMNIDANLMSKHDARSSERNTTSFYNSTLDVSQVPLSWRQIEPLMQEALNTTRSSSTESAWPVISHEMHPITGEPSYMLHPCHTAERMSLLISSLDSGFSSLSPTYEESGIHYLSSWINLTARVVGLCFTPQNYIQIQQAQATYMENHTP